MTRSEHLAWCKSRALEYCDQDDPGQAWASMASDLQKHPETAAHSGLMLGIMMVMNGHLGTAAQMREFIQGFN